MEQMEEFKLVVKRDLGDTEGSGIYGDLFCKIGGKCFPTDKWQDIISSNLIMWMDEISKFIKSHRKKTCDLSFMEGPYEIHLRRRDTDSSSVLIDFLYMKNCIDMGGPVSLTQIVAEINQSVQEVLKTPPSKGQKIAYKELQQKYEFFNNLK